LKGVKVFDVCMNVQSKSRRFVNVSGLPQVVLPGVTTIHVL